MISRILCGTALLAFAGMAQATISLSASAGNAQVSLNWSYSNETPVTQEVYRDTDSNPSGRVRIGSVSSSTRSFTATGLSNGTTYYFWIKNTVNGVATNSNTASATPAGSGGGGGGITGATCTSSRQHVDHLRRFASPAARTTAVAVRSTRAARSATAARKRARIRPSAWRTARRCAMPSSATTVSTACISTTAATCRTSAGPNVGEDAFTIKSSGTVNISGITGVNGEDKFAPGQCGFDAERLELHRRQRGQVPAPERRHHVQDHGQRRSLPDLEHE